MTTSMVKRFHGYGIMAEVKARTGGKLVLGFGTLYGTIKLPKRELVAEAPPSGRIRP